MTELNHYFFVMWPEDQEDNATVVSCSAGGSDSTTTTTTTTTLGGSCLLNADKPPTSSGSAGQFVSAAALQSLQKSTPSIAARRFQRMQAEADEDEPNQVYVVKEAVRPAAASPRVAVSCPNRLLAVPSQTPCRWCNSKDAEIAQLKNKVTQLEEQLCRALGNRRTNFAPSNQQIVMSHSQLPSLTLVKNDVEGASSSSRISPEQVDHEERSQPGSGVAVDEDTNQNVLIVRPCMVPTKRSSDGIELVPGSNVFISASKLQHILSAVKTGKQLARKLMSIFWDRRTLAHSTLSASSQHYDQLDPNIVSAIKTYCVLFDSSARKSEIHSTMIDKCVQSRRPRRSSLKQVEHGDTELHYHKVHISPSVLVEEQCSQEIDEDEVQERDASVH